MSGDTIKILLAMIGYMAAVIGIGVYFAKRAQANSENYFLGGRSLGPWVAAMSAEASDMSGWLLMGLPGVALLVWPGGRHVDGHWPGSWNLCELASGGQDGSAGIRRSPAMPSRCRIS